jgi:CHAT domain-containing protein/tetratricopeptide (TPR) repeat protein
MLKWGFYPDETAPVGEGEYLLERESSTVMTRLCVTLFTLLAFITPSQAEPGTAQLDSLRATIRAGQYDQAAAEAADLVLQWEKQFGAESLEVARALDLQAEALSHAERGDDPSPLEIVQRAIAIKTKHLGPDHLETAASMLELATLQRQRGESAEAVALFTQVLEIRTRELGPDAALVGDVHGSLGIALASSGRLQDAQVHFERSAAITEVVGGPDDPEVGTAYTNLATLYHMLGDLPAAAGASAKAIANIETNRGPDHPVLAKALYTLSTIQLQQGDIRAASDQLERARRIFAANDMQDSASSARVWNGLGMVAESLGDYPEAQRRFARALEIFETIYGPDHVDLSYYLNNMGRMAEKNGDLTLARASTERAVGLTRDNLGADNLRTVTGEYYLANLERNQGDLATADARLTRCLDQFAAQLGEDHYRVAEASGDLALVKEQKRDWDTAAALLDRALASNGGTLNPATQADLQIIRARVHLRQGDVLASCSEALEVEDTAAAHYRLIVQTLSEGASRRFATARTNGLSVGLSALLSQSEADAMAVTAWDRVIRSRGMLLDELTARRRLVTTTQDPRTRMLAADVFTARSRLADMYVRGAGDRSPQQYTAVLEQARQAKHDTESALAAQSAAFRSTAADRNLGLAEVRAALPATAAMVAYQRFLRISPDGDEPWYCAFVLADDAVTVVDLGAASVIDELIAAWRRDLLEAWAPGGVLAAAGIATNRELGLRLRDLVWTPCIAQVSGVKTIFVVPDGDLHLLPLAALPRAQGGFLIEYGPAIHYLSREKSVVRPAVPSGRGLLAFGDPAFDGRVAPTMVAALAAADDPSLQGVLRGTPPACEQLRTMQFGALPGTRRECEDVASFAGDQTTLLLGTDATEAAFKASLGGRRIVHLATHGYFVGTDCPTAADGYSDDPLLLAGLALAGANRRTEAVAGQEDGIVTAEEISLLDLAGVEWAVLSACDTGLGVLQPGEGVYGLQRAFETAGVGTVIMSLWPVEDQVTQQWMSALYRARLDRGQPTSAAMRLAAMQVLSQRRADGLSEHPFWWAGFVASGDWR